MDFVNVAILKQPYNWAIVWAIALLWLMLIVVLFPQTGVQDNASSSS
jgi:hypothetical protein